MSAWFLFTSLGFYSVTPATGQYKSMEKNLIIEAINNNDRNVFVQAIYVNGKRYTKTYFDHSLLLSGPKISFVMGPTPKKRKLFQSDLPYSLTEKQNRYPLNLVDQLISN
ncbi:Glycoside hydrolase family 92 protein [Entamoeba marina]